MEEDTGKRTRRKNYSLFITGNDTLPQPLLSLTTTEGWRKGKKHAVKVSAVPSNIHIIYGCKHLATMGPTSFTVYASLV